MVTAAWLAAKVDISPAAMTKYETKGTTPSPGVLRALAEALQVPPAYFFKAPLPDDGGPFLMRSLASSTKRARDSAKMKTRWIREIVSFASDYVRFPTINLPDLYPGEDPCALAADDVEGAAEQLRRHWGLRNGPIADLTGLLEANGIVVSRFSFGVTKLDAFSKWTAEAPILADNKDKCTAVRLRFDLAHELGHLVLHRHVPPELANRPEIHKKMEADAHRFAGAFIFPAEAFEAEVYTVALAGLLDVKRRWGMSAQAMIYRASDLGLINESQRQRAFIAISRAGFRSSEPLDKELVAEEPGILASALLAMRDGGFSESDIATSLSLEVGDVLELANLPSGFFGSPGQEMANAVSRPKVVPIRRIERA